MSLAPIENAIKLVGEFVEYYNTKCPHSAIGYITPRDKLESREKEIFAERDRKLAEAREKRKANRLLQNRSRDSEK